LTACIFYHPEAYQTAGPKLMGRNAAGESFLRGFFRYAKGTHRYAQVESSEHAKAWKAILKSHGMEHDGVIITKENLERLSEPGVLYLPGPGLAEHAWFRQAYGQAAWSLCGITHTTASARAMDALVEFITAPVQRSDALICTSTAVKAQVEYVLQAQVDYLAERLGVTRIVLPMLPVIPLGIHCDDFSWTSHAKAQARASLGIAHEDIVVLFVGRLSFHAKAHPLAMYQALEAAWQRVKVLGAQSHLSHARLILIECGWHANEPIAKAFAQGAAQACPSVRMVQLDGRDARARQKAWACADIFCSLSDNVQETFGITPIEAMAAGLAQVVTDWDGYKDTVRDGVDGFRIPTWMPQAGLGRDFALRHALGLDTYDMYCGYTASMVSVDIDAATEAFVRLFSNPSLRLQMGEAARERAKRHFDWSLIMNQYTALWEHQNETRLKATQDTHRSQRLSAPTKALPWPARLDPYESFQGYPSAKLEPHTRVQLRGHDAMAQLSELETLLMVNYTDRAQPNATERRAMLAWLKAQPEQMTEALALAEASGDPARTALRFRGIAWLAKLGLVSLMAQAPHTPHTPHIPTDDLDH
jgi:starch synthase